MEGKVTQLAEKLLKEGVERGEAEKVKILEAARAEAETLIKDAEKTSQAMLQEAQKKAAEMTRNAEAEIRLAGTQSVDALKQKITNLITLQTVDASVKESLATPAVMEQFIKAALAGWNGTETRLEVILSESVKADMGAKVAKAVSDAVKKEITFSYSKTVKGGFQVAPVGSGYKITFSDSDFADFFNDFLRPRIRTLLFGE